MEANEYIKKEIAKLDRGLVATPSREYLESFAKANQGSSDLLLMQMAINFGYKMALENILNGQGQYYAGPLNAGI